jgi:hypothetical protein
VLCVRVVGVKGVAACVESVDRYAAAHGRVRVRSAATHGG